MVSRVITAKHLEYVNNTHKIEKSILYIKNNILPIIMSSLYSEIQDRMITSTIRRSRTEYYFAIRIKNSEDNTFSKWRAVYSPFVITGTKNTNLYGDFLSSSWFKMSIPKCCEIAILKIIINNNNSNDAPRSTPVILSDMIDKMNNDNTFTASNFVIMFYSMSQLYFEDMINRLKIKLSSENDDTTTIHSVMNHEKGTIGMSFSMRKGESPCLYCPNFMLYMQD